MVDAPHCCADCKHFHPWPPEDAGHRPADGVCAVLRVALLVTAHSGHDCDAFRVWEPNHDAQTCAVFGKRVLQEVDDHVQK